MSNFNDLYDHVAADRSRAMQLLGIQDIRRKAVAELLAAGAYTEPDNIDDMTVTQKRAAIRTVVRKVVWDGKVAHVVLFGSPEDKIDWTTFPVDPEEDENDPEGGGDGSDSPSGVRSGEDSKRDPDAVPAGAQERADRLLTGNLGGRRGLGADLSGRDTGRLLHGGML